MSEAPNITPHKWQILCQVIDFLDSKKIPYAFTSAGACTFQGSQHPVHDLDIDVPLSALTAIQEHFKAYVTDPLEYMDDDDEFQTWFLGLEIQGVMVEFGAPEDFHLVVNGQLIPWEIDLSRALPVTYQGRTVMVQPLIDVLEYKRKLQDRQKDVEELEQYV